MVSENIRNEYFLQQTQKVLLQCSKNATHECMWRLLRQLFTFFHSQPSKIKISLVQCAFLEIIAWQMTQFLYNYYW